MNMGTSTHHRLPPSQNQRALLISLSERLLKVAEAIKITALYDEVRRLQQGLFEKGVSDQFLTYESSEGKSGLAMDRLESLILSAEHVVLVQRRLRHTGQQALQARCTEALKRLERLEIVRQHYLTLFSLVRSSLPEKASTIAASFFLDIVDMFAVGSQPYPEQQSDLLFDDFGWRMQEQQAEELTAYLAEATRNEFEIWRRSTLEPLLQARISWLGQELREYSLQFAADLKEVWFHLGGEESGSEVESERGWEKIASKMILDAPGRMVSSVVKHIEAVLDAPAMMARFLKQGPIQELLEHDPSFEKIQAVVVQEYRQELLKSYQEWVAGIGAIIDAELGANQEELNHALKLELQIARDMVHGCIGEKNRSEDFGQPEEQTVSFLTGELDSLRTFLKWYRFGLSP